MAGLWGCRKVRKNLDGTNLDGTEGQAQARRDPALHRARRLQRPRGGREQQDKGRDQTGLRLQEHGQPDRPHHAQVLGPEAGATGEDGFVIPTHTNSRSLLFRYVFT